MTSSPLTFASGQQGTRYNGPPLSGIFSGAADFSSDPGTGTVTKAFCTTDATATASPFGGSPSNVRANCDSTNLPHNEMSIAVDPSDPNHIVAGSNDYELFFQGAFVVERIIAGYYTSTDGGLSWFNGHVPTSGVQFTGDPAVAFNQKLDLVHYGVVGFNAGQGGGFSVATVQVSTSSDGGNTFQSPVTVSHGTGGTGVTIFNDKPYIAVDNNPSSSFYGRLYVTWTLFTFGPLGTYISSPIFLSFSDDGGKTFSTPTQISGSSSTLCANPLVAANAGLCNEDQFSSPVVGPDGTLYVAFENEEFQGATTGFRDQYLVVRSTDGGSTFSGPFQAAFPIFDGGNDYPINVNGRQTLSNSQFRVNSAGNLAVDPSSGPAPSSTRLYIAFSDNRDGGLTGSFATVTTNTDVLVVGSSNGGTTWNSAVKAPKGSGSTGDAFYPWVAVDSSGNVKVAFSDRSYDSANIKYGETLATSTNNGGSFSSTKVDTGLSNPNDSRWFTNGGMTNGKATFIGDYSGLAIGSNGAAHPMWTDLRNSVFSTPPPGRGHNTQDVATTSV